MTPNIEISTVVGCRMNCDYCPQKVHVNEYMMNYVKGGIAPRPHIMTFHDFKTMINKIPKHVEIIFAGMAEPFLNKWGVDMVLYSLEHGWNVGVYTTGSGLSVSEALRLTNRKYLHFTLHLPDADGRMNLHVTQEYLDVIQTLHAGISCQRMVIGKLHPKVEAVVGLTPDGSPGLFSRAGNLKHLAIPRKSGALECSACGPKIDHNILLPNGDVLLCCMDYAQEHVIGNLLYVTYDGLFESLEYKRIMQGLKDESIDIICRKCEVSKNV